MTTNHKPTFESRRGRELHTNILHARDQPAHKQLKYRNAKGKLEELKQELVERVCGPKENSTVENKKEVTEESYSEKRRRIQESYADESNSSDGDDDGDDDSDAQSEEDDEAELLKELQKIKRERELQKEQEQIQQQELELHQNKPSKSWRQDSMFKENNKQRDEHYVNDLIRSDFHKKFLDKYVR
jgi:protein CWC15